jgi:hypothetical protein
MAMARGPSVPITYRAQRWNLAGPLRNRSLRASLVGLCRYGGRTVGWRTASEWTRVRLDNEPQYGAYRRAECDLSFCRRNKWHFTTILISLR